MCCVSICFVDIMNHLNVLVLFIYLLQVFLGFGLTAKTKEEDNRLIEWIVGGRFAKANEFPYQVAIRWRSMYTARCGGSIIDDHWILTAAHCFLDIAGDQLGDMEIVVGTSNLKVGLSLPFHSVIQHKLFNSTSYQNDIALVYLKSKVIHRTAKWRSEAIQLYQGNEIYKRIGLNVIITGFGKKRESAPTSIHELKVSQIPMQPDAYCQDLYRDKYNSNIEFCAGDLSGQTDTCKGDSGGPVAIKISKEFFQIGITSAGIGCARKNMAGKYVKLSMFTDWIKRVQNLNHTFNVHEIYYIP